MARAYIKLDHAEFDGGLGKDKLTMIIEFVGAEIPFGSDIAYGEILFDPGDPVSQLRPKVTQVVLLEAAARGYVVAKQDMFIPVVQQGV